MEYLQKAQRKVDEWMGKHKEHAKVSMNGTSDKEIQCMANYTSSDTEANSGNRHGAYGLCGYVQELVMK